MDFIFSRKNNNNKQNTTTEQGILKSIQKTKSVATIEDNLLNAGLGTAVIEAVNKSQLENIKINVFGYNDVFVEHGTVDQIENEYNLTAEKISKKLFTFTEIWDIMVCVNKIYRKEGIIYEQKICIPF